MSEYVVDCDEVPYGDKLLVLPIGIASHVHEAVVRCRDCEYSKLLDVRGQPTTICYHRASLAHTTSAEGFCHNGKRRDGDGEPS